MKIKEIFENYDIRDLEINLVYGKVLIYEYIKHTQYEESGEFLGEFTKKDFYEEFEERFGKEPIAGRDYDII